MSKRQVMTMIALPGSGERDPWRDAEKTRPYGRPHLATAVDEEEDPAADDDLDDDDDDEEEEDLGKE